MMTPGHSRLCFGGREPDIPHLSMPLIARAFAKPLRIKSIPDNGRGFLIIL
jgi:hypothetical protein